MKQSFINGACKRLKWPPQAKGIMNLVKVFVRNDVDLVQVHYDERGEIEMPIPQEMFNHFTILR